MYWIVTNFDLWKRRKTIGNFVCVPFNENVCVLCSFYYRVGLCCSFSIWLNWPAVINMDVFLPATIHWWKLARHARKNMWHFFNKQRFKPAKKCKAIHGHVMIFGPTSAGLIRRKTWVLKNNEKYMQKQSEILKKTRRNNYEKIPKKGPTSAA